MKGLVLAGVMKGLVITGLVALLIGAGFSPFFVVPVAVVAAAGLILDARLP